MDKNDTGILLVKQDVELHREWFKEMCHLLGINVLFYAPKADKHYNGYGEFETYFEPPIVTGCIFEEHPKQSTMKKLGWVHEVQENSSLIHVQYDLKGLQVGALVIVPSGIDNAEGRVFRIVNMATNMVYPASITCELVPEIKNTCERSNIDDFTNSNFNLLNEE